MKRYITRHGQVIDYRDKSLSHLYPPGDLLLSELGKKQARQLGVRMRELGFKGLIISSPYMRALDTANIIAQETGCYVVPFAPLREIMSDKKLAEVFKGLTIHEIKEKYEHIHPDAALDYPWWYGYDGKPMAETDADVLARVSQGYKVLEEIYPDTELLIVSHGAPSGALIRHLGIKPKDKVLAEIYNCCLSGMDTEDEAFSLYCDTSHLSYDETTSNYLTKYEHDMQYFSNEWAEEINIPDEFFNINDKRILHIGDTNSFYYPLYKKLIEKAKPDVIIHTGDLADELKAGRIPEVKQEYIVKIGVMTQMLKNSSARLIIVPGNNDLPEEIKKLCPDAEFYPYDSVVEIDGVECRIGHPVSNMSFDKKWSFYGHGPTGDKWNPSDNGKNGEFRFNSFFGGTVCLLKQEKFFFYRINLKNN